MNTKEPQYLEVTNEKGSVLVLLLEDIKLVMKAEFKEDGIDIKMNISRVIKKEMDTRDLNLG